MNQEDANKKFLELINKKDDLLSEEIQLFKELMFRCDLKIQNKYSHTPLIYALRYNQEKTLKLNEVQWDYLIKNSDLKQKDNWGWTPLMIALKYNKDQNLNLNQDQINYLIKNSDLKQQDKSGYTPLMYALIYNKNQNLNINKEQWNYLIQNSDLRQQAFYGETPLMYALRYNQDKNLNQEQWDYLIKQSDLNKENSNGYTYLIYALMYNKEQNLQLTTKQLQTMYDALNEEQKQITFQKLIKENIENKNQYLEEINLLLYDCEFQPHEKTLSWLKKNKYQDIIQMIKKRDLFFQLNQTIKEIDKHKKIATIKI